MSKYFFVTTVSFGCAASSHSSSVRIFKGDTREKVLKYCFIRCISVVFIEEVGIDFYYDAEEKQIIDIEE